MGKSESGAIWLDKKLLSEYDYWQFWRNSADGDVLRFLRAFTDTTVDEISEAAILFIRTHVSGGGGLAKDVRPPPSVDDRWQSAQSGMGSFASTASLKDITRPFEA